MKKSNFCLFFVFLSILIVSCQNKVNEVKESPNTLSPNLRISSVLMTDDEYEQIGTLHNEALVAAFEYSNSEYRTHEQIYTVMVNHAQTVVGNSSALSFAEAESSYNQYFYDKSNIQGINALYGNTMITTKEKDILAGIVNAVETLDEDDVEGY